MKVSKKFFNSIKNTTSIRAKEFMEASKVKHSNNFEFSFKVEGFEKDGNLFFCVYGKHYSKNKMDKWHRGNVLKYKKAIKQAFSLFFRSLDKKLIDVPSSLSRLTYTVYNPKSRDDDANYNTLKIIRDCLIVHHIIQDDSRKFLLPSIEKEIISKDYKIKILVEVCQNTRKKNV